MTKHPSVSAWENGEIVPASGPENLTVSIAGRCNLSCFMCGHSIVKELPVKIDVQKLEPFLKDASNLVITGGEPLWIKGDVNRQAGEILETVEDKFPALRLSAFTNGVYLPDSLAERVIKQFHLLSFSIDSLDPAVYKKIRGKDLLPQVLMNLEKLLELKRKNSLGINDEPLLHVNAILAKSTADTLPALAEYLSKRDVQCLNLVELRNVLSDDYRELLAGDTHANTTGKRKEAADMESAIADEIVTPDELGEERINRITGDLLKIFQNTDLVIFDRTGVFGKKDNPVKTANNGNRTCPLPWINAEIHSNGNVYTCCANGIILGNVNENCFDEIWNGEKAVSLREAFLAGEMAGCVERGCSATIDYFSNPDAHSRRLLYNLKRLFKGEDPSSILFLRTAPPYQSRLALKSLAIAFPESDIKVITNRDGETVCRSWSMGETLVFPEKRFEPSAFAEWQKGNLTEKIGLVAAPCANNAPGAYENIERILKNIEADTKLMIMPGGEFSLF